MKKILILYFSGVGNTKYVAGHMQAEIQEHCKVDLKSIEEIGRDFDFSQYDRLVFGTPTFHSEPARPVKEFLKAIKKLEKPMPSFLFATYGLYPENVLRIFAKLCLEKNIVPVFLSGYRCSANDGKLLFPGIMFLSKNEKRLEEKIKTDIEKFLHMKKLKLERPRFKWYAILNYPNKWLGKHYHFKVFLHKKHCMKCGKCARNCPVGAIGVDEEKYPFIDRKKCMNCYRCIYQCPRMALSLFEKKRHNDQGGFREKRL